MNKSLYTISYMLITSTAAGLTFCALYLLVSFFFPFWVEDGNVVICDFYNSNFVNRASVMQQVLPYLNTYHDL